MQKQNGKMRCCMLNLLKIMFVVAIICTHVTANAFGSYCDSSGNNAEHDWIESTQIGSTVNTSGKNNGYGDYTNLIIDLDIGENHILLEPGHSKGKSVENWRVWIDMDHSGSFEPEESVFEGISRKAISGNFTIPASSLRGNTRMRISMKTETMPNPCEFFDYGEVEDYQVNILPLIDETPPMVSAVIPPDHAIGIPVDSAITVQFSENIDCTTIDDSSFFLDAGSGHLSGTFNCALDTISFTPTVCLDYNTTYTAGITTEVRDQAGNHLANNFSWSFKTKSESIAEYLWSKTYGGGNGEHAFSLLESSDGYIFAGYSSSFDYNNTYNDIWVMKIGKQSGEVLWEKRFGSDFDTYDYGRAIVEDEDGYLVAGSINSPHFQGQNVNSDVFVMKLNKQNGSLMWQKSIGGANNDSSFAMIKTGDGYVLAGQTQSFGVQKIDVLVVKIDSTGNVLWEKTYGGPEQDTAYSVCEIDTGYIVTGYTYSFGAGIMDCWVLKIDKTTGDVIWEKTYGGSFEDIGNSVIQAADHSIVVAGVSSFGGGSGDGWILKIDPDNGNVLSDYTYGISPTNQEQFYSVQETPQGFIVAGISNGGNIPDTWILKINNEDGNIIWEKTYGEAEGWERSNAIIPVSGGGYLAGGSTGSFGIVGSDLWLMRIGEDGGISADCPAGMGDPTTALVESGHAIVSGPTGTIGISQTDTAPPNTVIENNTNAIVRTQCSN